MPPKKPESGAKDTAPPPSRRSARLEGKPSSAVPESNEKGSKKRSADSKPASTTPSSKKPKPTPSSKSTAKKNDKSALTPAEEEKEEEAPKSAKPTTSTSNGGTNSKGKALTLGDTLPKITLKDNAGEEIDVSGLAGEKGVVVFLYPKADTPGCTTQACGFRDSFDEISELGYDIYGLSKDTVAAQQKWLTKKSLNYKLLSDPESKLIKRLGAFVLPNNTKRSHFIFEKGSGKLVDAKYGVKPADDPKSCLDFIKKHHA